MKIKGIQNGDPLTEEQICTYKKFGEANSNNSLIYVVLEDSTQYNLFKNAGILKFPNRFDTLIIEDTKERFNMDISLYDNTDVINLEKSLKNIKNHSLMNLSIADNNLLTNELVKTLQHLKILELKI